VRADVSSLVIKAFLFVQLGYLEVTVQQNLRSGWPGPFVKVEGCCDTFAFSASRHLKFSYKSILPCTARVFRSDSPAEVAQWLARSIPET
jgi:hypothetical protein